MTEFKPRNFELNLEKFEPLHFAVEPLAKSIAQGWTLMHWEAECDARDVEFVLGSSPTPTSVAGDQNTSPPIKWSIVNVWLLDINQCRKMAKDEDGIKKAGWAFWDNDPYYPRRNSGNERDENL
jgi:hypothetical protein